MCLLDVANENKLVHRKRVLGQQQHLWLGHSGQCRRYLNGLRQSKHVNFATSHAVHRPPRHSVIREIAKSSQSTRSRRNILIAVRASNANKVGHFVRVCDRSFAHFTFWRANKQCGQLTKDYYIYPYVYTIAWRARASMRRSKRINTALCGQSAHTHASLWYSILFSANSFLDAGARARDWRTKSIVAIKFSWSCAVQIFAAETPKQKSVVSPFTSDLLTLLDGAYAKVRELSANKIRFSCLDWFSPIDYSRILILHFVCTWRALNAKTEICCIRFRTWYSQRTDKFAIEFSKNSNNALFSHVKLSLSLH